MESKNTAGTHELLENYTQVLTAHIVLEDVSYMTANRSMMSVSVCRRLKCSTSILRRLNGTCCRPKLLSHPYRPQLDMGISFRGTHLRSHHFCTTGKVQSLNKPLNTYSSTMWGKAFAIAYALVGIPIFMWYIVKLGGLFRVIAIKIVAAAINCIW